MCLHNSKDTSVQGSALSSSESTPHPHTDVRVMGTFPYHTLYLHIHLRMCGSECWFMHYTCNLSVLLIAAFPLIPTILYKKLVSSPTLFIPALPNSSSTPHPILIPHSTLPPLPSLPLHSDPSLSSLLLKVFRPVLLDLHKAMQSKTVASSDYERPIQVLAELLEIRAVSEKGGTSWPICELVCSHHIPKDCWNVH